MPLGMWWLIQPAVLPDLLSWEFAGPNAWARGSMWIHVVDEWLARWVSVCGAHPRWSVTHVALLRGERRRDFPKARKADELSRFFPPQIDTTGVRF